MTTKTEDPRDQFRQSYEELTADGWDVSGVEKHSPSSALGCVHVVRILTARKGDQKITQRFIVSEYPLFLYSGPR